MKDTILIRAGNDPEKALGDRELGYCRKDKALYIGTPNGNVKLTGNSEGGGGCGIEATATGHTVFVVNVSPFKHDLVVSVRQNLCDVQGLVNANTVLRADGSFKFTKTTVRSTAYSECIIPVGTAVTFSVDEISGTVAGNVSVQTVDANGTATTVANFNQSQKTVSRSLANGAVKLRLMVAAAEEDGSYVTIKGFRVAAEPFEINASVAYNGEEYPADSDGTVRGMVSVSPTMEMSVTDGYEVSVQYYKKGG